MTAAGTLLLVESNTTGTGRLFPSAARALGLEPVVVARDPGRYPYLAADRVRTVVVDTSDVDAIATRVEAECGPVAGVCTSTDRSLVTVAELARRWGRPGLDPAVVGRVQNKHELRRQLLAGGFASPRFDSASKPEQLIRQAETVGYPLVVKPTIGTGSLDVRRCDEPGELAAYLAAASDRLGQLTIEQYLTGAEYSVESIDGEPLVVTGKHLGPEPYFVELGHDVPAALGQSRQDRIKAEVRAILKTLGAGAGPAHTEVRVDGDRIGVIEINLRLAGGRIPMLVELATGLDLITLTVASAVGRPVPVTNRTEQAACIRFVRPDGEGRLGELAGQDQARAVPGVAAIGTSRAAGEEFRFEQSFRDRAAYVIAGGDDLAFARRAAESAARMLSVPVVQAELATEEASR